jgi:hypothetical protein
MTSAGAIPATRPAGDRIHSIGLDDLPIPPNRRPIMYVVDSNAFSHRPTVASSELSSERKQIAIQNSTYEKIRNSVGISIDDDNSRRLGDFFFDQKNIDVLQEDIVRETFVRSNRKFTIRKQRQTSLVDIMKRIFVEHALLEPCSIHEQVEQLNRRVVEAVVPGIIVNCMSIHNIQQSYQKPRVDERTRPKPTFDRYKPLVVDNERFKVYLNDE